MTQNVNEGMTTKARSRGFRTERCPVCSLPLVNCVCSQLKQASSNIHIVLLRHLSEAVRPSGTGFLALYCIQSSELLLPTDLDAFLAKHAHEKMALLFPPDGAEAMPDSAKVLLDTCTQPKGIPVQTLIVPDGSWQEARRMVRKHALLRSLPRVSPQMLTRWIDNPLRSDKWVRPCTAEAIGQWLQEREQQAAAEALRISLRAFVDAHWKARGVKLDVMQNAGDVDQ